MMTAYCPAVWWAFPRQLVQAPPPTVRRGSNNIEPDIRTGGITVVFSSLEQRSGVCNLICRTRLSSKFPIPPNNAVDPARPPVC